VYARAIIIFINVDMQYTYPPTFKGSSIYDIHMKIRFLTPPLPLTPGCMRVLCRIITTICMAP